MQEVGFSPFFQTTFTKPLGTSTPVPKAAEKPVKGESSIPVKAGLLTPKAEAQTPTKVEDDDVEIPDTYNPTLALGIIFLTMKYVQLFNHFTEYVILFSKRNQLKRQTIILLENLI